MMNNDPRSPIQKIILVSEDPNGGLTSVTLDCGHTRGFNQTFTYRVGETARCFACAQNIKMREECANETFARR